MTPEDNTLANAIQPYLEKGYQVITISDTEAELRRPKDPMGWWIALLNTGAYARNRDRTAYVKLNEAGAVEVSGDTLEKLVNDERADKGVQVFRVVMLVIFAGIFLSCGLCVLSSLLG